MEYRIIRPDGQIRWIHREVELVRDSAGKALSMVATEQDITERRRMEEELQREHSLLVFAQRMAGMGSAEVDLRTGFAVRSDEFFRLVGADSRNPPDGNDQVAGVFHHDDQERVAEAVRTMLAGRPVPTMELRIVRPDGEIRWLRRDQDIILGNDGKPERAVVTLMDITDQKLVELQKDEFAAALISLANHDALTGLPAARLAGDRLLMACHQAGRERTHVALLFIDLDGFKAANDRHGHAAGDLVLKEVASRLRDAIRSGDTAARHGGDEFLVILNGVGTEAAKQVAAKLCDVIGEPIYYGAAEIRIGASIGIAIFPDHARTPEDLLRLADQAMYAVKRSGKNGFTVYAEA
jgi:diguanylate cyclase (GGDEF)-like protein